MLASARVKRVVGRALLGRRVKESKNSIFFNYQKHKLMFLILFDSNLMQIYCANSYPTILFVQTTVK
jgi:hypothetical protein